MTSTSQHIARGMKDKFLLNASALRWGILLLLIVIPSLTNPDFRTLGNLEGFLESAGVLFLVGMGEAMVLMVAGIDLSVGGAVALGSTSLALLLSSGIGLGPSIAAVLAITTLGGVINGVVAIFLRVPSFITTFAMMGVEYSIALGMSGGNRIGLPDGSVLPLLSSGSFLGIPLQIWLVIGVLIIGTAGLRYLRHGRYVYAVGSNMSASHLSGVRVRQVVVTAFALSGLLAGLGAVVYTARIASGNPIGAFSLNLEAIASAVIGGVNLFGGRGTLFDACTGVFIYLLIDNVLNLYGVNPNITEFVGGLIILLAAYSSVGAASGRTQS